MDLRYTPTNRTRSGPRRARGWPRPTCPPSRCRASTPRRASPSTASGSARCSDGRLVGGVVAGRVRRPRRRLHQLADLRGGVLPRRRAGAGQPERHLPARPDDHGGRHRRAEGAVPADDGVERDRLGAGVERAQRRAATSPRSARRRAHRRRRRRGSSTARRSGRRRAVWADWCFGIFRTDPDAERHRGLTFILVPLDSPGITVRPIAQLDGDTGFAEIFFDDVRVPVENTLGEVDQGWRVAMATAGFERGRQPAQPGPVQRRRRPAGRAVARARRPADTALRDAVTDAWMQAEGYRLHTYMTVTHMIEGRHRSAPRRASTRSSGARWTCASTSSRSTSSGPRPNAWTARSSAGSTASCSRCPGPIYAGTNEIQRNIIADRVLQLPKGLVMRFAFTDDQTLFADGLRDLLAKECTAARTCAPRGTTAPATTPALWNHLAEMGVFGMLVPEAAGGLGGTDVDLVLLLEELGRAAVPGPVVEPTAVVAPVARRPDLRHRSRQPSHRASTGRRTCRTPHVASVVLVPGGVLRPQGATADRGRRHRRRAPPVHGRRRRRRAVRLRRRRSRSTAARWPRRRTSSASSERMIDIAAEYARQREQFGRPIGVVPGGEAPPRRRAAEGRVRQGPRCTGPRGPSPATRTDAAARRLDGQGVRQRCRIPRRAAARCRCTARIGYTWEADLQLWMKKAWALQRAWGDATFHRRRVAATILA